MPIENVFEIDIDIKQKTAIRTPTVTQNDAVVFIFRIFDEGRIYNVQDGSTFTMTSTRLDKQAVMTIGEVVGENIVQFELGSTEIAVKGKVESVIQVYDAVGRVSTIPFSFTVLNDPSIDYVPSEDEQTLIQKVLGEGPAILANAEQATEEANTAANLAKETATNADETATHATELVNQAELELSNLSVLKQEIVEDTQEAVQNAEMATQEANIAADNANEQAEFARQQGEGIKDYADSVIMENLLEMAHFEYALNATSNGQKVFTIPLNTFDKAKDKISVIVNRTYLAKDDYTIVDKQITLLNDVVNIGEYLYIEIIKNVKKMEQDTTNGAVITDNTLTKEKFVESVRQSLVKADNSINKSEKGVPNGVAKLNAAGKVVDANGNEVGYEDGGSEVTSVNGQTGDVTIDVETPAANALSDAKSYSDGKLVEAKNYSDAILVNSKTYTDSGVQSAKDYTDQQIAGIGPIGPVGSDDIDNRTDSITWYVRSTGNDNNDGLTEQTAFKTFHKAFLSLKKINFGARVINVGAGVSLVHGDIDYRDYEFKDYFGGSIEFNFNDAHEIAWAFINIKAKLILRNFKRYEINNDAAYFSVHHCDNVEIHNMSVDRRGINTWSHPIEFEQSRALMLYCDFQDSNSCVYASKQSFIFCSHFTGKLSDWGVIFNASDGAIIDALGTEVTSPTEFETANGGQVFM